MTDRNRAFNIQFQATALSEKEEKTFFIGGITALTVQAVETNPFYT